MELILKRELDLITYFSKYKVSINGQDFFIKRSGTYPIVVEDANSLKISVIAHNYYSSTTNINGIKSGAKIVIVPSFNRVLLLILTFILFFGLIYGISKENRLLVWGSILLNIAFQFYYFNIRRKFFFKVFVQ